MQTRFRNGRSCSAHSRASGGCHNCIVDSHRTAHATTQVGAPPVPCAFCEIVANRLPAAVVHRDDASVAFLDRSPLFKGHVLVVPTEHVPTLSELPTDKLLPFFLLVQRVAAALPAALGVDGTFVAINNVVSQSVAHLHAHVVPRRRKDGLRGFFWPRVKYADESELVAVASLIRERLAT
ncbi:MAG: HIT family protein [Actinobacteria bacterium]|nr:HIT family protein [Actinomycetota bacterium]